MTKPLNQDQRGRVAEKVMELGNLVFAGFVIAQALQGGAVDFLIVGAGIAIFALAYFIAITYMKGGEK